MISRRQLLHRSLAAGSLSSLFLGKPLIARLVDACSLTPRQGEGPYYPESGIDRDSDLTNLEAQDPQALGQVVLLGGVVQDHNCNPIRDAVVEVWQACVTGRYSHSEDPNTDLRLDPNFQYWGRARTDFEGAYRFKTIIPGHYPTGPGSFRPPHIHFKVHARGFLSLTTQMYFDKSSYDDPKQGDIAHRLNLAEGVDNRLKVSFVKTGSGVGPRTGVFNITLRPN